MNKELYDLLLEVEKIIKGYDSTLSVNELPTHHQIVFPSIALEKLKRKYLLFKELSTKPQEKDDFKVYSLKEWKERMNVRK